MAHFIIFQNRHHGFTGDLQDADDDIAILKTDRKIEFGEYIQPACLPPAIPLAKKVYYPGNLVTISGWGKWGKSSTSSPDVLQAAEVEIVNHQYCTNQYASEKRKLG